MYLFIKYLFIRIPPGNKSMFYKGQNPNFQISGFITGTFNAWTAPVNDSLGLAVDNVTIQIQVLEFEAFHRSDGYWPTDIPPMTFLSPSETGWISQSMILHQRSSMIVNNLSFDEAESISHDMRFSMCPVVILPFPIISYLDPYALSSNFCLVTAATITFLRTYWLASRQKNSFFRICNYDKTCTKL